MIMLVDLTRAAVSFAPLVEILNKKGEDLGVLIRIQREDIFKSMHHL